MYTTDVVTDNKLGLNCAQPKVAILMCTFNGQRFLHEQLESIKRQTHNNWELHISDDGSTDATLNILSNIQSLWPKHPVRICNGPRKGFVQNFLSLACKPDINADYYAFSDQDDVWEADKLSRALQWLDSQPKDIPALYCSRTRLIDENGKSIGLSPLFKRKPSFKNALVQSIAGANTMVFNQAARELLIIGGYETPIVSHDWWLYMLVTGCGGAVFYDPAPSTGYRQHEKNLVGANAGWMARKRRITASFQGRFAAWNDVNLSALSKLEKLFTKQNKTTFVAFTKLRSSPSALRSLGILRSGLYRQTLSGNISLLAAALIGKI